MRLAGRYKPWSIALLAAGAYLFAGCGHTAIVGGDRTLRVALSEYHVTPQSARVSAGELTISVHNYGRLTHNLAVSENGQSVAATKAIWPGQDVELALDLAPGKYVMASTILSDQSLGAYGTLTVTK